jgi:hypothetical protein
MPQSSARAATSSRPRPDSESESVAGGTGGRPFLGAGVRHLDADDVLGQGEVDVEVPAGDVTVAYGVGGEFRRDEGERLVDRRRVRVAPVVQAVRDESAGEAGTARCRSEAHGELAFGCETLWHMPVRGSC